jgi:hypothetical protein
MSLRIPLVAADGAKSSITLPDPVVAVTAPAAQLWGGASNLAAAGAGDNATEWARVNASIGGRWTIRRSYQPAVGGEWACPAQPAGAVPFRSQKLDAAAVLNGSFDAQLTAWLKSIGAGWCSVDHEPDQGGRIAPDLYDRMINYVGALCLKVNPAAHFGPVVMEFQIRKQGSAYAYCRGIDPKLIDFWGVDAYSNYDIAGRSLAGTVQPALDYFRKFDPTKPVVVAELGNLIADHDTGAPVDRAAWLAAGMPWCAANNVIPLYYDVDTSTHAWKFTAAEWARFLTLTK